jgi:hypothetical protein
VVVTGADGYRAPLALAELDSATAARSVRQVVAIAVGSAP